MRVIGLFDALHIESARLITNRQFLIDTTPWHGLVDELLDRSAIQTVLRLHPRLQLTSGGSAGNLRIKSGCKQGRHRQKKHEILYMNHMTPPDAIQTLKTAVC